MLDLTPKQAQIIKIFVENYRDESNKISKGITAEGLEKFGVEPKTFRNHKDYFLEHYFLRLNTVEYHGGRNWFYFQITRLGVLAYLKWQSSSDVSEVSLDKDFFPLLFKYWDKLVGSYEKVLFDVLTKTLSRIEIRPEFEGKICGEPFYGGKLDESIVIHMGMIEVKIFRKYKQPELQENPKTRDWGVSELFESLNQEIDEKITERFTFLFILNLLHLGTSIGEFMNLIFLNNVEVDKESKEQSIEEEENIFRNEFERTKENTSKLFSIIGIDFSKNFAFSESSIK